MARKEEIGVQQIGAYAFLAGVLVAVIVGIAVGAGIRNPAAYSASTVLLVLLGLAVGYLNIREKESVPFLAASIALAVGGGFGPSLSVIPLVGSYIAAILLAIASFVVPAAIVVALKTVWDISYKQ